MSFKWIFIILGLLSLAFPPASALPKQKSCKSGLNFILSSPSLSTVDPGEQFEVQIELPRHSICRRKNDACEFQMTVPDGAILMSQDLENVKTTVNPNFSTLVAWTPSMDKQTITFSADVCAPVYKLSFQFRLLMKTSHKKKKNQGCVKSKPV